VIEEVEHADTWPAASVVVARKVVVLLFATGAVKPGEANAAAVPVAAGGPLQSDVV
jgi:hypothetical protein